MTRLYSRSLQAAALSLATLWGTSLAPVALAEPPLSVSGIYPHLASFNYEGAEPNYGECGIGAVVPWAGKLWWITYPPHMPKGGRDKLFSTPADLSRLDIAPESVGGTHANRMIHKESNQLIIGPYFISAEGKVRACDLKTQLVARITATARHLTDPANLVYMYDMEGRLYEVNVHTLAVKKLFDKPVPGWHGKGGYTAQGRLVVSNNGEDIGVKLKDNHQYLVNVPDHPENAGVLAEWDGKEWRIIERRQFTDITGPGDLYGSPDDQAPLWAMGWDKRSVILKLLDHGTWSTYRVPKGSYTFDPKHGWYTEWPRIRKVQGDRFMMVMHGQMFDFPATFSRANSAGIRPIATHLRYIPDFCSWQDQLVLASDDTSIMANPLAGQPQSNLWFGKAEELKSWGPTDAWGGVWLNDAVTAGQPSDPFLFAGYAQRTLHLSQNGDTPAEVTLEIDAKGDGSWAKLITLTVPAHGYVHHLFPTRVEAEWIRLVSNRAATFTAYFHYANKTPHPIAKGEPKYDPAQSALVRPAKGNRNLQVVTPQGYYEVDETLTFSTPQKPAEVEKVQPDLTVKPDYAVDAASVILTDKYGQRWRIPRGAAAYDHPPTPLRGLREIQSERYFANWHGSFYEVPRTDDHKYAPNFMRMKPVATHNAVVEDFCTWRGILVLTGGAQLPDKGKVITAPDGKLSLWLGKTDDLWHFGKPVGKGGPWKDSAVKAGIPSDPYLMTNYDQKTLTLTNQGTESAVFSLQVDTTATNQWQEFRTFTIGAGKSETYRFPEGYHAHWLRLTSDRDTTATAELVYE